MTRPYPLFELVDDIAEATHLGHGAIALTLETVLDDPDLFHRLFLLFNADRSQA